MYSAPAGKAQVRGWKTEQELAFFCNRRRLKYRKAKAFTVRINPEECEDERGKAIDLLPGAFLLL
jgi:hypothetical protein